MTHTNEITQLATSLVTLAIAGAHKRSGEPRTPDNVDTGMRASFRRAGIEPDPFGKGNSKTGAAGTYGKVGDTCPSDCPMLPLHSKRETAVDWLYVLGVRRVIESLRDKGYDVPVWTYTHAKGDDAYSIRMMLEGVVSVRISDHHGEGGAVVGRHDAASMREMKAAHPGTRFARCLSQTAGVLCVDCGLCWERPELAIVFDPHGATSEAAADTDKDGGCYATGGNVNLHQTRASVARLSSRLAAVAMAYIQGAVAGMPVRLHVSGDFFRPL